MPKAVSVYTQPTGKDEYPNMRKAIHNSESARDDSRSGICVLECIPLAQEYERLRQVYVAGGGKRGGQSNAMKRLQIEFALKCGVPKSADGLGLLKQVSGTNRKHPKWHRFYQIFNLAHNLVEEDLVKDIGDWRNWTFYKLKKMLAEKERMKPYAEDEKRKSALLLVVQMLQKAHMKDRKVSFDGIQNQHDADCFVEVAGQVLDEYRLQIVNPNTKSTKRPLLELHTQRLKAGKK